MPGMSLDYDVIGVRLPNGKIQIMKDKKGTSKGTILENDQEFCSKYSAINEGTNKISAIILDTILE